MRNKKILIFTLIFSFIFLNFGLAQTNNEYKTYAQCLSKKTKELTQELQFKKKQFLNEYKTELKEIKFRTKNSKEIKKLKYQARKKYLERIKDINNWFENEVKRAKEECKNIKTSILIKNIEKFESEEDFKNYLKKSKLMFGKDSSRLMSKMENAFIMERMVSLTPSSNFMEKSPAVENAIERVSETNIQVAGIDEPDIVKTDGKEIYFSPEKQFHILREPTIMMQKVIPPYHYKEPKTKVIKAFPPSDLSQESEIEKSGNLLLVKDKNILVIFSQNEIFGYDVSNPQKPQQKWNIKLEEKNSIVTSRLYKNKIYLFTKNRINEFHPCPITPLKVKEKFLEISCQEIYHPILPVPVDTNFMVMVLNPVSGKIENKISFIGSSDNSVVYMSDNAIYITYSYYDSSFSNWFKEKKYEIEKTGIVKIGLENLEILAQGNVPGYLLNQFALDEYKGNLRVAVTIGEKFGGFRFGIESSYNEVYILDKNLKIIGSVKNLGPTERIYSVRFIEDKGYVATFRETDPFYVLDLSDPKKPELKGELKIHGYSSYLHPITKDKILGIGKEGWKVKISLFDVSLPEKPKELDKYILDESWSEILSNHHAFLLDEKHKIFFLPGGRAGYVFSYDNDKLELIKSISKISAKRAIYINDYLYIIGDNKITVLNEFTLEKVNELVF